MMPLSWEQTEQIWRIYKDSQMESKFGKDWYDRFQTGDSDVREGFIKVLNEFRNTHPEF